MFKTIVAQVLGCYFDSLVTSVHLPSRSVRDRADDAAAQRW